jgi:hypothetical protein
MEIRMLPPKMTDFLGYLKTSFLIVIVCAGTAILLGGLAHGRSHASWMDASEPAAQNACFVQDPIEIKRAQYVENVVALLSTNFKAWDKDGDGYLDEAELHAAAAASNPREREYIQAVIPILPQISKWSWSHWWKAITEKDLQALEKRAEDFSPRMAEARAIKSVGLAKFDSLVLGNDPYFSEAALEHQLTKLPLTHCEREALQALSDHVLDVPRAYGSTPINWFVRRDELDYYPDWVKISNQVLFDITSHMAPDNN